MSSAHCNSCTLRSDLTLKLAKQLDPDTLYAGYNGGVV